MPGGRGVTEIDDETALFFCGGQKRRKHERHRDSVLRRIRQRDNDFRTDERIIQVRSSGIVRKKIQS
jgi:hypothetical protein